MADAHHQMILSEALKSEYLRDDFGYEITLSIFHLKHTILIYFSPIKYQE